MLPDPCHDKSVVMLTRDRQIDRRTLLQADSLESAGWNVTILAMPLDTESSQEDRRVVRIGNLENPETRVNLVLTSYKWIRIRMSMNGYIMRLFKRFAWRYIVDQESFFLKIFSESVAPYSPAVFVAVDLPMLPVAWHAANMRGSLLVYDSHELFCEQDQSAREKNRWAEIEKKYIHDCDAIITVNESIATELRNRYQLKEINVITNAEKSAHKPGKNTHFHDRFRLSSERKVLLLQGGLSGGRNIEHLIEAIKYVKNPLVDLVILGRGLLLRKLEIIVKKNNLSSRVYFHPAVPQNLLISYTQAADVGVIPYQPTCLNNYLCTPNKLFEYIAAGIPVLASDLPEIRGLIQKHDIGIVGDMSSPGSIAALIDDVFSDNLKLSLWRENILDARKYACWEKEEKKLINIFDRLCQN